MFEVNSETDFVAKNEQFLHLLDVIQNAILDTKATDVDAVLTTSTPEGTIADLITNATATIGEKSLSAVFL